MSAIDFLIHNLLLNNMVVNFNMLGSLLEYWFVSDADDGLIVAVQPYGRDQGAVLFRSIH